MSPMQKGFNMQQYVNATTVKRSAPTSYSIIAFVGSVAVFFFILFNNIATEDYIFYPLLAFIGLCFVGVQGWNVFANRDVVFFATLYGLFLLWALFLTLNADFTLALHFYKAHTISLLSFLFLASLRQVPVNTSLRLFTYTLFGMMALVALLYFTIQPDIFFTDNYEKRLRGYTEHANQFYIVLLVPGVIGLYVFRYEKIKFLIFGFLLFLLVLLTGSKTGMATMALVLLGFSMTFFLNRRVNLMLKFASSLIFLAMAPAIFFGGQYLLKTLNPYYYNNLERVLMNPETSTTVTERTQIIEKGLNMFMNSPLIGIGPNQQIRFLTVPHFHNFVLDYAVCFGLPGLALVLFMMAFVSVHAVRKNQLVLLAALAVLVFTTLSSDSLGRTFILFAIIAGFALRKAPVVRNTAPRTGLRQTPETVRS